MATLPNWTTSQIIGQLDSADLLSGTTWTLGFPTSAAWVSALASEHAGFSPLNAAQKSAVTLAMQLWDDLIAPNTTLAADPNTATIKAENVTNSSNYAYGFYPDAVGWEGSSLWLSTAYSELQAPVVGDYSFMTYLHELGHTLGLNHMGNYDGSATWPVDASSLQDSHMYTVMSYFEVWETGQANWSYAGVDYEPETPMVDDILAIQHMYGADKTTRATNTTYGFHASGITANELQIYDFSKDPHPVLTIYDAGGNDVLDLSGFTSASKITLLQGQYSSVGGLTNNIGIAYGTTIENAVGGTGNDTITGNGLNNHLWGGPGADRINAGTGHDTMTGGIGADIFILAASGTAVDTISDFVAAGTVHDRIQISKAIVGSYASMVADHDIAQVGANTVITLSVSESVTLLNVDHTKLAASDFLFV